MLALRHAGASLAVGSQSGIVAAAVARRVAPCVVRGLHSARAARWAEQDSGKKAPEATNGNGEDSANKAALKSAEELHADLVETSEALKKCQELIEKEKAKADEFKDKYVRSLAENENVRKRAQQDVENAKQFSIQRFSLGLTQVADVFDLAVSSVPKAELETEANTALRNLHSGVIMTGEELQKVFKQFGVEKMDPLGQKFDPKFHEAVYHVPDPTKEPNTVFVVQKTGYTLNGRTLRPAVVGVVRDPSD